MKSKLTILLLFISSITFAQYGYSFYETGFGVGVGYNLTSVVGKEIHPVELSLAYRIYDQHLLRLYAPIFNQNNSFSSDGTNEGMMKTSLDTKKHLFGIGFDYDYALQTYSYLDFVVGARVEYAVYKDMSDLSNSYMGADANKGADPNDWDDIFKERKTRNFVVSPSAGFRLRFNRVYIDAKLLLSMLSMRGDEYNVIKTRRNSATGVEINLEESTETLSNKFKLKPAVVISTSFFF